MMRNFFRKSAVLLCITTLCLALLCGCGKRAPTPQLVLNPELGPTPPPKAETQAETVVTTPVPTPEPAPAVGDSIELGEIISLSAVYDEEKVSGGSAQRMTVTADAPAGSSIRWVLLSPSGKSYAMDAPGDSEEGKALHRELGSAVLLLPPDNSGNSVSIRNYANLSGWRIFCEVINNVTEQILAASELLSVPSVGTDSKPEATPAPEANPDCSHNWSSYVVTVQPGCEMTGLAESTCSGCGSVRTTVVPAFGHYWEPTTTPATCTKDGSEISVCLNCNQRTQTTTPALGHSFGSFVTTREATCTAAGVRTATCSRCGDTKSETVPALGHNYGSFVTTREATCTAAGVRTATCSRCGDTKSETIPALGHNYGSFVVTAEASCTRNGVRTATCSRCGDTKTETIPSTGHSFGTFTTTREPTCTTPGSRRAVCTVCGRSSEESIPALGHSFENGACTRCGVNR